MRRCDQYLLSLLCLPSPLHSLSELSVPLWFGVVFRRARELSQKPEQQLREHRKGETLTC